MIKILSLMLLFGIVPVVLGLPWTRWIRCKCPLAFAYGVGCFEGLALFHVICMPAILLVLPFHTVAIVYSVALGVLFIFSLLYARKYHLVSKAQRLATLRHINWLEWVLIIGFAVCVTIQVIRGFTYDITYMSYDDARYTTYATDTLETDIMMFIDPYTGIWNELDFRRAAQTYLVYPAYCSWFSGFSVAATQHTIQYVQFIVLAYSIYIYMAGQILHRREYRLVFLVVVSVFYFFGYHSHYSLTFRLLGPNYQGKAILAVSLTPLVLTILVNVLSKPYKHKFGILLLTLSTAAVSLTLWGIGTIIVIGTAPIILSFFRKRHSWKHLWYIMWVDAVPALFLTFHLLFKFVI